MQRWRKTTRLTGFDYTLAGGYFVTICVHRRICDLGRIQKGVLLLTPYGKFAERSWHITQDHFENVTIDSYIIMPNHVHAIILIHPSSRGGVTPPLQRRPSLGEIVAYYKYQSTKQINQLANSPGTRFWQRNYYDHIIRDERDLEHHRRYILENPRRWEEDKYYSSPEPSG
jgi:REP element-mobilizing transposase RayT